jgi:predicted transcriptional regulator
MTTTTLRIDDALKSRVADAAQREGKTPHAFMLEAIADTVEKIDLDNEFHRVADARWAELVTTGKSIAWDQAKLYLAAKARGETARKPSARKPGARNLAR